MKSLCVYCGSNFNGDPVLRKAIEDLAETMATQDITLVFGGGSVGVMGVIADEILKRGGKALGVIPQFLMDKEVGHKGLTEMVITENMHQRKQKMADLSDGFVILPGGFGTLDEFFEALTLIQTNKIGRFPIVLVGKAYWTGLVDWIKTALLQSDLHYISESDLELFCVVDDATEAVKVIDEFYSKYLLSPNF
mgnify:CR=1 FL=1